MMRNLIIVTDAWHPQINGVVRSIENTIEHLADLGVTVTLITPEQFYNLPCPTYPEIRLSLVSRRSMAAKIEAVPDAFIHIATEGPLGLAARAWCLRKGRAFTTCYHTRFPEYIAARVPIPVSWIYRYARWFHNAGSGCMVATDSLHNELSSWGFKNLMRWSRGINQDLFRRYPKDEKPWGLTRPVFMNVGRVAIEKNLEAFLALDLPGSKVVVGDGPARAELEKRFPEVHFTGAKSGEDLARAYAQGDVFVFPSRTDTFGNAIIEAMACGVPVAAFPVMGPVDILTGHPEAGALDEDLRKAAIAALDCSPEAAAALAATYSWPAATAQFFDNVLTANVPRLRFRFLRRFRRRKASGQVLAGGLSGAAAPACALPDEEDPAAA